MSVGQQVTLGVRPEHLERVADSDAMFTGEAEVVEQLGDQLPEHQTLAAALHQIRLAFVEVQNQTPDDET